MVPNSNSHDNRHAMAGRASSRRALPTQSQSHHQQQQQQQHQRPQQRPRQPIQNKSKRRIRGHMYRGDDKPESDGIRSTEGSDYSSSDDSSLSSHDDNNNNNNNKMTRHSHRKRDEVQEIRDVARKDTINVIVWRFAVTGVLLLTAVAVTLTTYSFLQSAQRRSFETTFEQFAFTIGDSAMMRQESLLKAFSGLSHSLTTTALTTNATWPNFIMPQFESFAADAIDQAGSEACSIFHLVKNSQQQQWLDFVGANYVEHLQESHRIFHGTIDALKNETTSETATGSYNYHDFITAPAWTMIDASTSNPAADDAAIGDKPQQPVPDVTDRDLYLPALEFSPPPLDASFINFNAITTSAPILEALLQMKTQTVYGTFFSNADVFPSSTQRTSVRPSELEFNREAKSHDEHEHEHEHDSEHEHEHELEHDATSNNEDDVHSHSHEADHPHSVVWVPIHDTLEKTNVVGVIGAAIDWNGAFRDVLPDDAKGIVCVIQNSCGDAVTYEIDGGNVNYLGEGDIHERSFDDSEEVYDLSLATHPDFETTPGHCRYSLHIYPSTKLFKNSDEIIPEIFAAVIACTFVLVAVVFFVYDMFVQRRNEKLIANAARSNAIVSSLFPENIRDRLIALNAQQNGDAKKNDDDLVGGSHLGRRRRSNLKSVMNGNVDNASSSTSVLGRNDKPLADLFLETTILFADIAGFTAWSSVREPSQVFTLLETVFSSFDELANVRRVFKVETVGDCYVAASGIPEYKKDHAIVMVRFARDILQRMDYITKQLEITLGPDTGDLSLRIGIHSGPVTAGVLRGERARFQLFGDTMNTASRIEHTGAVGRIHLSSEAAEVVRTCGKGHWLIKREGLVEAKGKGEMQTYWIDSGMAMEDKTDSSSTNTPSAPAQPPITSRHRASDKGMYSTNQSGHDASDSRQSMSTESGLDARSLRLVGWNVEMLLQLIKQIVARREAAQTVPHRKQSGSRRTSSNGIIRAMSNDQFMPLDEVQEIIRLPAFDKKVALRQQDPETVKISPVVVEQLRSYVSMIASMYQGNAFHNFDHASHVTMSVIKLLSRIVGPSDLLDKTQGSETSQVVATLHDHTYGITSDPLTQFACAFAALIHDVDHCGVPNAQLIKEGTRIASVYNNRSVAEQNSLVLAWDLLMLDEYDELRSIICETGAELTRFRQLVVNAVMATDIADKDLKALRNARWDKAFKGVTSLAEEESRFGDSVNRKATIVIEHLIQASDVAHTMQHWHVYRKWNERFFQECYASYLAGRAEQNPLDNWYKGEIGFFDYYIIPLAKKLKDCGVFGISSDEYLNYALANRNEWERRGKEVIAEMAAKVVKTQSDDAKGDDGPSR